MENSHNKLIIVLLSLDNIDSDILNRTMFSIKGFQTAIKNNIPEIYTTQTSAISSYYYDKGYDIKIISDDKQVLISDLLNNRTIRPTQNWEKLLYSNYLDINCDWERCS